MNPPYLISHQPITPQGIFSWRYQWHYLAMRHDVKEQLNTCSQCVGFLIDRLATTTNYNWSNACSWACVCNLLLR